MYYYQKLCCPIVAQGTTLETLFTSYICSQIRASCFLFLLL
jgi:hypothetical protein